MWTKWYALSVHCEEFRRWLQLRNTRAYWLVLENWSYARRAPAQNVSTRRNGPRPETRRWDLSGRGRDETETRLFVSRLSRESRPRRRDWDHILEFDLLWIRSAKTTSCATNPRKSTTSSIKSCMKIESLQQIRNILTCAEDVRCIYTSFRLHSKSN